MLSVALFVICIGPFCVPVWGFLPLLLFAWNYLKSWCLGTKPDEPVSMTDAEGNPLKDRVVHVESTEHWDKLVAEAKAKNVPLFVDFSATWCGPCKKIAPLYTQLAATHTEDVDGTQLGIFTKVDIDKTRDVAKACGVGPIPTFQVLKNGYEKKGQLVGANPHRLKDLVAKFIQKKAVVEKGTTLVYDDGKTRVTEVEDDDDDNKNDNNTGIRQRNAAAASNKHVTIVATPDQWDSLMKDSKSNTDTLYVVHATAKWSQPCKLTSPEFAKIAQEYTSTNSQKTVFASVDLTGVKAVGTKPHFSVYSKGVKVSTFNTDAKRLSSKIKEALSK